MPKRKRIRKISTREIRKVRKTHEMPVSPFEKAPIRPGKKESVEEPELEEVPGEEVGEERRREEAPGPEPRAESRLEKPSETAPAGQPAKPEAPQAQPSKTATKTPTTGAAEKGAKKLTAKGAEGATKGAGAAARAGGAAAKTAGSFAARAGAALAPYLVPIAIGCAVIIAIIGLVFLVVGCSGKLGTTPSQGSEEKLEDQVLADAGDVASANKLSIDIVQGVSKQLDAIEEASPESSEDTNALREIVDRIKALSASDTDQRSELTQQLRNGIFNLYDKLGVYIPYFQSSWEGLGTGVISKALIDPDARVIIFSDDEDKRLGFAPIYFGKKGDSKPDILSGYDSPFQIVEVLDKGKGSEFIDYSGRKCGRYILKLSDLNDDLNDSFRTIGSSPEDKITAGESSYKVLYATGGDLRMFSSDLAILAPRLKKLPIEVVIKRGVVDLLPENPDTTNQGSAGGFFGGF